ncbi:hypothetical protein [Janibacter limosus]|uniref:Abortive infection protein-like C-terminal domain-containing protein n=1 Tax=Janibacter limosus TaxID=53458 RepID=A0A4P6MU42_9MICO|nr:hypothetical protein [Janibacter limosus]QBF46386.1 hypothetical protein EXU32_09065 [Janibacter limosus]
MTERFVPLNVRMSNDPAVHDRWNVLHEGMPPHLRPSVEGWLNEVFYAFRDIPGICARTLQFQTGEDPDDALRGYMSDTDDSALRVVDMVLQILGSKFEDAEGSSSSLTANKAAKFWVEIDDYFVQANSAWRIEQEPTWMLGRIVDETTTRAFEDVRDSGTTAGRLLAEAWQASFKHDADYTEGYRKAVLAVESVAISKFCPDNTRATLGTAIRDFRSQGPKWTVAGLDDQVQQSRDTLLAMLESIWQNQQRHVKHDGNAPEPAEQDETEAVLFLAITIVQWFQRGFVQKKPGS